MIRQAAAVLLLLAVSGWAPAREVFPRAVPSREDVPGPAAKTTVPRPSGYRFDHPQLLTQQLLWGIFHGVRLLGLACQARSHHQAALAYADWSERQRTRIRAAQHDLARYYFHQESAAPEAISTALGLKPALDVSPELLTAACDSLPEALAQERYDLEKFYARRRAAIERGDPDFPGAVWKEPAPDPDDKGETPSSELAPPAASGHTESPSKENP